jgi:hypothetical protein
MISPDRYDCGFRVLARCIRPSLHSGEIAVAASLNPAVCGMTPMNKNADSWFIPLVYLTKKIFLAI